MACHGVAGGRAAGARTSQPATQADQPNAGYYFVLGRYLEGEGQIPAAIAALKRAIELEPKSAEPRAELAALYARQDARRGHRRGGGRAQGRSAEPRGQSDSRLRSRRARRRSEAARRRSDDRGSDPRDVRARDRPATARGDLSLDLTLARLYLTPDRSRRRGPAPAADRRSSSRSSTMGGCCSPSALRSRVRRDEAADALLQVLEQQPSLVRARVQLAELYEHQRRWTQAAETWAKVQERNPAQLDDCRSTGLRAAQRRQAAEARSVVNEALKLQPGDAQLSYLLAQAQRDLGNLDAAETIARQLKTQPSRGCARGRICSAQILEARGRYQEVVDLLTPEIARLNGDERSRLRPRCCSTRRGSRCRSSNGTIRRSPRSRKPCERAPDEPIRHAVLIQGLTRRKPARPRRSRQPKPRGRSFRTTAGSSFSLAPPSIGLDAAPMPRTRVPRSHRAGSARRQRAELPRLHARRARRLSSTRR